MILQWRPDNPEARAGAVAVTILSEVLELVGRLDIERVVAQAGQQLPLLVQTQLILYVHRAAFDFGVTVAKHLHAAGVAELAVGVEQVKGRHRLRALGPAGRGVVQLRIAALAADLDAGQQAMLKAKGIETAFQFEVVIDVAGGQILLPVLARNLVGFRIEAGQVGVVEIAVELEYPKVWRSCQLSLIS